MITVQEVKTKKQQRQFVDFPLELYKDNPYFVPPLYGDEKKMFRSDYVYYDTCESVFYNAYRDGKMVGRIQGILQKAHNEKTGEKRIRFTRFDAIDDQAGADALFGAGDFLRAFDTALEISPEYFFYDGIRSFLQKTIYLSCYIYLLV
jgi:hypothetical protein